MVNINIVGRLGADAELITGKNGKFVSFRMACDDRKNNEKITSWFRVTLNGERAEKLVEYLTKGKLINVIGTETVGTYTAKDGTIQVSRDINATNVEFISVGSGTTSSDTATEAEPVTTGKFAKTDVVDATKAGKESDDDLPF